MYLSNFDFRNGAGKKVFLQNRSAVNVFKTSDTEDADGSLQWNYKKLRKHFIRIEKKWQF